MSLVVTLFDKQKSKSNKSRMIVTKQKSKSTVSDLWTWSMFTVHRSGRAMTECRRTWRGWSNTSWRSRQRWNTSTSWTASIRRRLNATAAASSNALSRCLLPRPFTPKLHLLRVVVGLQQVHNRSEVTANPRTSCTTNAHQKGYVGLPISD